MQQREHYFEDVDRMDAQTFFLRRAVAFPFGRALAQKLCVRVRAKA
jgi:hypothetical protein|tara:strand:- start:131 stop:268 length:138 start_codon:yes stop_codon:yes gene_type:complete